MDHDLQPYIIHYALTADVAQDSGDLDFWPTLALDIPDFYVPVLETAARHNGCDLETLLAALSRKKAREVLAAHGMLDDDGRLRRRTHAA